MGCVIERKGTTVVDGFIEHDDRPSTFEAAEALAGRQLDRRRQGQWLPLSGQDSK